MSTPYDTPEIVAARKENAARESTHLIDTPSRRRMRERIAAKLYGVGAQRRERSIFIVLGLPAGGKSKLFAEPLVREHGALLIDADVVKERLPEYGDGRFAGVVHQESSDVADVILAKAASEGQNIVLPFVGRNPDRVVAIVETLREIDYVVHVVLNDVPATVAASRSVRRFVETGRFVDPAYVLGIGDWPLATYGRLKAEGLVDTYARYSNNVPEGAAPQILEASAEAGSR